MVHSRQGTGVMKWDRVRPRMMAVAGGAAALITMGAVLAGCGSSGQSSTFDVDDHYDYHYDVAAGHHSAAGVPDRKESQPNGRQFVHTPGDRATRPN